MSRPLSRRTAIVAAALGVATAAAVSACGSAQAGASTEPRPAAAPAPTPAEVERARRQLDDRAADVPASVTSWGVDPAIGLVVVRVTGKRTAEVDRFLSGIDPRTLRVVTDADPVRPLPGNS